MSTVFELDEAGWDQRVADARLTPQEEPEPGVWDNALTATGQRFMRGFATGARTLGVAASVPMVLAEKSLGTEGILTDDYFKALDDTVSSAVDYWTPDARTTGAAGRILGGLAEIAVPLGFAIGGNPIPLIATQQLDTATQLVRDGVDSTTAQVVGNLQGASIAAGFKLAPFGKSLGQRVFTSAVGNAGLNMATTFAQQKVLEARGYEELAEAYDPLDVEGRTVDLLMGAAFGFVPHGTAAPKMVPSARNAVLAGANARHFQVDTAPGRPLDANASAAHQRAMETAMRQLFDGDPVSVDPEVTQANFETRPVRAAPDPEVIRDAIGDIPDPQAREIPTLQEARPRPEPLPPEAIPRTEKLDQEGRDIETRFADQIRSDVEGSIAAYDRIAETNGGKVINTDIVRELSPDYLKDRSKSGAVHEPASFLTKEIYKRRLADAAPGEEVIFASGGAGSGKSTGLDILGIKDQIVYDGTLSKMSSATKIIEQALAADQTARIVFTYRDPKEAFVNGALRRSMGQEKKFGSGRTVPIDAYVEGHAGAREVIGKLMEKYKDNPKVAFDVIDNSRGIGEAKAVELADLPKTDYNGLREELLKILEEQRASGAISEAIYRGTAGAEGLRAEVRGGPEQGRARGASSEVTVSTASGRKLQVRPKLIELDAAVTSDKPDFPKELQPRQRGARKALDQQVRDIAQNLDPARLGDSAEADRGAPITDSGNVVESGNGRVMALRYAYENLPEKAAEYRAFLEAEGYDTKGMKQPVLVRERLTALNDSERQAFTVEANQAATAALSPVERAQADARLLDAAALSAMRGGDLTTTQNSGFVRAFLERLTGSERNAMLNPDGSISQEGVRRIQAALLAKAYGGKPESNTTLGRMLESTDSDMRAALGALLDAAPAFARLRQSIADGKVAGEYDISGALTQAIENTAKLRLSGQSLRDFLAQGDMLTARAPIVDNLMKALYDKSGTRIAGREKIAGTLTKYAGQAARQRLDQASLFAEPPVSVDDLVNTTTTETEAPAPKVTDMFGLKTPQGSMVTDAAKAVLEESDIQVPTGAVDADGNMEIRSGREIMAEAEAEIAKAEADAVGFDAAVSCIMTRGLDDAA